MTKEGFCKATRLGLFFSVVCNRCLVKFRADFGCFDNVIHTVSPLFSAFFRAQLQLFSIDHVFRPTCCLREMCRYMREVFTFIRRHDQQSGWSTQAKKTHRFYFYFSCYVLHSDRLVKSSVVPLKLSRAEGKIVIFMWPTRCAVWCDVRSYRWDRRFRRNPSFLQAVRRAWYSIARVLLTGCVLTKDIYMGHCWFQECA